MTFDVLITDALVVNADGRFRADVGVTNGVVTAVFAAREADGHDAARIVDAAGRVLIPGGVDAHCHVAQVTGRHRSLDTFETATVAALHGGTTTIIDFGIPSDAQETPLAAVQRKLSLIDGARCAVALHGSVVDWDETIPGQLQWMGDQGIRSVKLYTTNRGTTMADDTTIVKVMKEMVRLRGLTYIHCEHDAIIEDRISVCTDARLNDIAHLHMTRPALSEVASVQEMLALAKYTGAPIYLVHQSTPEAVRAVHEARSQGQIVYSEVCPHYLCFDESVYSGNTPEKYACCPPMRPRHSVDALVEMLARGQVDVVSSDHSCYNLEQKRITDDVRFMPHGLPGVETRMAATFTTLVTQKGASIERFVDVFSAGPARINGLPTKGRVAVGMDADLVLFDPDESRRVDGASLHMGTDHSPFDGMDLCGWPSLVVSAGTVVLEDGRFFDPGPVGGFLGREPVSS